MSCTASETAEVCGKAQLDEQLWSSGAHSGREWSQPSVQSLGVRGLRYLAEMNLYEATKIVQADPRLGQACESVSLAIFASHLGKRKCDTTSAGRRDYKQLVNAELDKVGISERSHRQAIETVCQLHWSLSRNRSDYAWWEKITRSNFVDRLVNR